jgi:predicted CoA-binding protein
MDDQTLRGILQSARTIAVVGLSPKEDRPSHRVAAFLKDQGYRIIPVHLSVSDVLEEKAYPSLTEIPEDIQVDVVDVFRRPEDTPPIADEAVARRARVLWLQEGIINEEAAERAQKGGLQVIMDRCMLKEHKRLMSSEARE